MNESVYHLVNARVLVDPAKGTEATSLSIAAGKIATASQATVGGDCPVHDCHGDWLIPGLIDLHSDAIEKRLLPRPGVDWPAMPALIAQDQEAISAGVTTLFHALAVGTTSRQPDRLRYLAPALTAIEQARSRAVLQADHRLHLRCEVSDPLMLPTLDHWLERTAVDLLSLMNHAPERDDAPAAARLRDWIARHTGSDAQGVARQFDAILVDSRDQAAQWRAQAARRARDCGIPLAIHDPERPEDVEVARQLGATIAEFPLTELAARWAKQLGMRCIMGAPNVVRALSSIGKASARDLIGAGLVDALVSDYVPSAPLLAVAQLIDSGLACAAAVALVTSGPADLLGLPDRGRLFPGLRADVIQLRFDHGLPLVRAVWVAGQRRR